MISRRMGYLIDSVVPLKMIPLLINQILILCGVAVVILIAKAIFNLLEQIILEFCECGQSFGDIFVIQLLVLR